MALRIVTDSTSDIPPKVAQELGITVIPLYVHFGAEVYRDGIDLCATEFYQKLVTSKSLPTTSTISPGEFAELYDTLSEQTNEILVITLSSKLSATYDAAIQGQELRKSKGCRVEVIDSRLVLMALGLIVIAAAQEAQAGASLEQVVDIVKKALLRVHVRMAFDTLDYVRKGGRIGRAQAFLGTLLSIKPILTVVEGETTPVARERTRDRAIEHLRRFAGSFSNIKEMAVEYTTTPEEATALVRQLDSVFPEERIYISNVGSVMGTHLGPGALGIALLEGE
ncbi:DegV family protein [Chloroflexota bacterium]